MEVEPGLDARRRQPELAHRLLDLLLRVRELYLDLRELDLGAIDAPELEAEQIAEGATVLDLRSQAAYRAWHYPEAQFLDFDDALRSHEQFDKSRKYVLYCEFGLKSAQLAELMHDAGYDVSHFGRGLRELLDYARRRGLPTPDVS